MLAMTFPTLLGLVIAADAQQRPCTLDEAQAAEAGTVLARRSWADLHAQFVKYSQQAACDDGAIAEGWSDAVAHLLAKRWEELPHLARLASAEPAFLSFVRRHIDLSAGANERSRIRGNAGKRCPTGHGGLCAAILDAIASGDAEASVREGAPDVAWRRTLALELDGDGRLDFALLGRTAAEAVVGVVLAASPARPDIHRFRNDPTAQSGGCGDPAAAVISVEPLPAADDPDVEVPSRARAAKGVRRMGFRLDGGGCDAFHFFFDGQRVTWWRR